MNGKVLRVALYIRVSTDRQAKEGESLEAQEVALRKYAKENNYIVVDTYIDGGESGQKLKRTNLTRMLEDVKENKIDLIIMTKLDRWFRSVSDFYKVQEILVKHKVGWKTIWEDYDTTTATGEFWLNMSLSLGRMEAKRTGERIDVIFDHKYNVQKTVCSGAVPYGYKISDDKKMIIDEEKANHIKQLFEQYIKTNCLSDTVRWFQANINQKSYSSIKLYLKNTAYIGLFKKHKNGEIVENFCPKIIDVETFYKVQQLFKNNIKAQIHKGNTLPYIFGGLLSCGECKNRYTGLYSWRNDKHYYRCKKAYEGSLCHSKHIIPEHRIENYLINNIISLVNKKMYDVGVKEEKQGSKDNAQSIKKKLERLVELYTSDIIDIDYYKKEYEELNKQLNQSQNKKEESHTDFDKIKSILNKEFFKIYSTLDNIDKRRIWASIIDNIEINGKDEFKVHLI